jgi:hypothetical protein
VGATKGDNDGIQDNELDIMPGSLQGFISKINLVTLHERWTIQWGAKNADLVTDNCVIGCHVEAGVVYVAGVVEDVLKHHPRCFEPHYASLRIESVMSNWYMPTNLKSQPHEFDGSHRWRRHLSHGGVFYVLKDVFL